MKRSSVTWVLWFMVGAVLLASAVVVVAGPPAPFLSRFIHRLLHLVGAVGFLGNILVGAFWLVRAELSQSSLVFQATIRGINLADVIVTGPSALLLLVNGAVLSSSWGGLWTQPWLKRSVGIFGAIGLLWALVLVPLQLYLQRASEEGHSFEHMQAQPNFRTALRAYSVLGACTGLLASVVMVLMVLKNA